MANRRPKYRTTLAIEQLECRAVPTAGFLESFDSTPVGGLPTGWSSKTSSEGSTFQVSTRQALGSERGLTSSSAYSAGGGRVWNQDFQAVDVQVTADVRLDSLSPAQLLLRGQNLDTDTPSYYAVSITRGLGVQLLRVVDGQSTVLKSVNSQAYHSENWIRLSLLARGDTLQVQVFRTDTAQYLTRDGTWTAAPAAAIEVTDTVLGGAGYVGLNRPAAYAGSVSFDNVTANNDPANAASEAVHEQSFANNQGRLPSEWTSYTSGHNSDIRVDLGRGLVGASSLAASGSSRATARTWLDSTIPADAQVSAAVFLDSLNETHILGRGSDLASDTPDYYAVSISRGLTVSLVKVVDGRVTELARRDSSGYFSNRWVQVTLSMQGDRLRAQVYRTDTAQYLNANGEWQVSETWALEVTDGSISGAGYAGVNRPPQFAGSVSIDNFVVRASPSQTPAPAGPVSHSFENQPVGQLPSGWTQWSNHLQAGFEVSTVNAQAGYNGLVATGGSTMATRAWLSNTQAANVQVSTSIYLDSLVPAQVIARGQSLNTDNAGYYAVNVTRGLELEIIRVSNGQTTTLARLQSAEWVSGQWARVTITTEGNTIQAAIQRLDTGMFLNANGRWQATATAALQVQDNSLTAAGSVGLGRPARFSGRVVFDEMTVTVNGARLPYTPPTTTPPVTTPPVTTPPVTTPPTTTPPSGGGTQQPTPSHSSLPDIPQHYDWIRIAMLAYSGTPLTAFEQQLLAESIDLVVPNINKLNEFSSYGDNSHLIYSNVSNLYLDLLADWLNYADAKGVSREAAFYHAAKPTAWEGASASSRPVDRFWAVYTGSETNWSQKSSDAYNSKIGIPLAGAGTSIVIGDLDKFREVNITLSKPATGAWAGSWEYASAVDAAGNPTEWKKLKVISDTTAGMNRSGRVTFDPPSDWSTASINGTSRLFYVRFRTTVSTGATPVVQSVRGRDYVNANGGSKGTIPVFDYSADKDGDGYLNDAEWATRKAQHNARFVYESRLFHPYYGQHRYSSNLANPAFRAWAADFNYRYLEAHPNADGILMDNSGAKSPFLPGETLESTENYTQNYATLLAEINKKIAPRWILGNTASAGLATDQLVQNGVSYMEEFGIRPLAHNTVQFEDLAEAINRREQLSNGKTITVLDSHPRGGDPTDPRFQIATLAYFYLISPNAERTFLMFNGGNEPSTSWTRHWSEAVKFDVGKIAGDMKLFATGADPANSKLTYKVYGREYENSMILYKPLSYKQGVGQGTLANNTATTHQLNGNYRVVRADGTLGPVTNRITLRNGEGVILAKV